MAIETDDILYAGSSQNNVGKISKNYSIEAYEFVRIVILKYQKMYCVVTAMIITPLEIRREVHLLLFMHKQPGNEELLKMSNIKTRLHQAPVFKLCKPNNEKVRQNTIYRGALVWNKFPSSV